MVYIILGVGIAVLIALIFAFILRKYTLKFREKLALLFIGFLLVPSIPLAFITINLLTNNIDMWSNKRIEKALEDSFTLSQSIKREMDSTATTRTQNITSVLQYIKQLQMLKKPIKTAIWILFLGGIFVLAITGTSIARTLSKKIERPIYNLVQGTNKITQGDFGHQIIGEGEDEIGTLIKSFNKMSKELSTQRETLKDIERLKAYQEIARRVSHEIKNPLTSIGISIDRLSQNIKEERDKECLSIIKEEIGNLKHLASEFAEFARLPELKFAPCNLNEVVKSVAELHSNEEKIKTDYYEKLPEILMDKNSIRQVLINLINNSIEAGGEIKISTSMDKEWAVVKVCDTGKGIPDNILPKIFEPYITTKSKGTGLGLPIAKKIILDHKGQIEISSEESKGTAAVIKLPLSL
ncbi:MAG: ATP-binding protein [bacterium]